MGLIICKTIIILVAILVAHDFGLSVIDAHKEIKLKQAETQQKPDSQE